MASQTQSQTSHRRSPAGQGIVIRPSVGHGECRYCHEVGHHISQWNRETKTKEMTCPKLIAKEARKQRRAGVREGNRRQFQPTSSSNMNLSAWFNKAKSSSQGQRSFVRHSKPIEQHKAVSVSNRFSSLAVQSGVVNSVVPGPKPSTFIAPAGVWGAPKKLHSSIADVLEAEEEAVALGLVAKLLKEEKKETVNVGKLESLSKIVLKVSFSGDSESLMKPPCTKKVFHQEDPALSISDDEEEEKSVEKLVISKSAWRSPAAHAASVAVRQRIAEAKTDGCACANSAHCDEKRSFARKLLAQKEKALEEIKDEGSWADCEEQDELERTVEQLKKRIAIVCRWSN
jgi:hypothetical protein